MTVLETPQSEGTAPTLRRVFHNQREDAVTFDHHGQRIEVVRCGENVTIARYTPGNLEETVQTTVLPGDTAIVFTHPEVQELLLKA